MDDAAERELLRAIAAGDGNALECLYRLRGGELLAYLVTGAPFHSASGVTVAWWQDRAAVCVAAVALSCIAAALARSPERLLRSTA